MDTRQVKVAELGRAQAIRIPKAFEFAKGVEYVYITQDPATGDLTVSARPAVVETPLEALFRAIDNLGCRDQIAAEGGRQ